MGWLSKSFRVDLTFMIFESATDIQNKPRRHKPIAAPNEHVENKISDSNKIQNQWDQRYINKRGDIPGR